MEKNIIEDRLEFERNLWEMGKRRAHKKKFELVLKLYSLIGLLVSFFSVIYFILITIDIELSKDQILALTIAGVGLTLSVSSWALLTLKRDRMATEDEQIKTLQELSEYLIKWSRFEIVAKNVLFESKEDFNKYSIREIIDKLLDIGIIDRSDYLVLDEAIKVRNAAIHSGEIIPKDIFTRYSNKIDNIISKILNVKPL